MNITNIVCKCAACTFANNSQIGFVDKKILIAYFSWGGNTKSIAERIYNSLGGNIFRIKTAVAYPADYNEVAYGIAK